MRADELRESYIRFFVERGHVHRPSDSLVPTDDPTLLFTGAGMNQFKEMFLGRGHLPFRRAVTSQKCLRAGDIANVGRTSGHHTFLEMLGNFSFGDYFKAETIAWAWEYLTNVLGIPADKLRVSVYEDDQESYDIWKDDVGVPAERIYRFDAKENFWPADAPAKGPNGPCGPCSEIFFDRGEKFGCDKPNCGPNCDCDRYLEIWNLVFTQFNRADGGKLNPLPNKGIDTGMGFERTLAVLNGKPNNFETELFMPIIKAIEAAAGMDYERTTDVGRRMRRIADHVRAVTFCIADGVLPSNEGRGYVVRKLLRIATGDAKQLSISEAFLYKLVPIVSSIMESAYPEVKQRREYIARVVKAEEKKFRQTLDAGLRALRDLEEQYKSEGRDRFSGEDLFRLYDTYGLPIETTVNETNMAVSDDYEAEFETEMARQRELARKGSKISADIFVSGGLGKVREEVPATEFLGYDETEATGTVLAIISNNEWVENVTADDNSELTVVLDRSPFYGEQGGQVGDTGSLTAKGMAFEVTDTQISEGHTLHVGLLKKGTLKLGATLSATVDAERRADICRNHTATHMMHAALREVVGEHAEQSGSLVAPDHFRFDFTHFEALTREQIQSIEDIVNEKIRADLPLTTEETDVASAIKSGARALFGEKYGDRVKVVTIENLSKELCGGTHCSRTGTIGVFRITAEESIAAGVRRITAITGRHALASWRKTNALLDDLSQELGAPLKDLSQRASSLVSENRRLQKEIEKLRAAGQTDKATDLLTKAPTLGGVKLVVARLDGLGPKDLRTIMDRLRKSDNEVAAVLASVTGERVSLMAGMTEGVISTGLAADKLLKEVAEVVGGGGGGRAEMAQAGGNKPDKTDKALELARQLLTKALEKCDM